MTTYTAKGSALSKASGASLEVSAFSARQGSMLLTMVAYDDASSPLSVKWGNRLQRNRPPALTRDPAAIDIVMTLWVLPRVRRITSHPMTTTWNAAIVEKAMLVGEISGKNRIDQATGANFATATDAPETGLTATLSANDDFAVAYFISEGPDNNDTFGTMEILNGGVWTAVEGTHRIGTNGAPPVSNVTITSGWLNLTSSQATNARLTGATSRSWTCGLVTLKDALDSFFGVCSADINDAEDIFEALGKDPENATFKYNYIADRAELYDEADMTTLIAYWSGGAWVTV